jgi:peptidoglycan/LPS O-acetylase OafA/YrhL
MLLFESEFFHTFLTFSFLGFYKRRAKRILPAFYLLITFAFLAAIVLLSPFEAYKFAKWATAALLSVSNIGFSLGLPYFGASSEFNPMLMTWSLGVEEQFYAVIPLLMVLLASKRRRLLLPAILVVCALSFVFAWGELSSHPSWVFFSLPARAWELGVGVALAVAEISWKDKLLPTRWAQAAGLMGLVFMLVPMCWLTSATPFPGVAAVPSVLGTALVIAAPACWTNQRLLALSPLVFVGRVSYSWYLWHWPLLAFLRITAGGELPPSAVALAIAASFAAAVLSYYTVEQPFRRSSRAPGPLLFRYALVSLVFVGVGGRCGRVTAFPSATRRSSSKKKRVFIPA